MRAVQAAIYMPRHAKVLEIQAFLYRKTKRPLEPNICIQLLPLNFLNVNSNPF